MKSVKPYLAIFTTILLFSTIEVAVVSIRGTVNHFFLAALRFGIAGVVMALVERKKFRTLSRKDWLSLTGIGVIALGGTFGPYHIILEENMGTVPQVALIFSLNPLFASLVAIPLLKEKLRPIQIAALLLGFIGAYVIFFGFSVVNFSSLEGPLLMIWTAFAFGAYTTFNKQVVMKLGPLFTTGVSFLFAAVTLTILPIIQAAVHGESIAEIFIITELQRSIPVILYLSFITTLIGYALYFYGLKRVPVAVGTAMFYLKPLLATLFTFIVLPDSPAPEGTFYIGMTIIFAALALSMKRVK